MVSMITGFPVRGDVTVYRRTGVHRVFNGESQTDTERGNALGAAMSYAQDKSTIVLAGGTFDIGTGVVDLSLGGTGAVNLYGMGRYSSVISSAYTAGGANFSGAILHPGTGSEVSGVGVLGNLTNGDYQAVVGAYNVGNAGENSAFTGAVFTNCKFAGQSDSFYINHQTACSGKFYNCEFTSSFDSVLLSSATAHVFQFYNCTFSAIGPNLSASSPGRCRCIRVQQGLCQIFGGEIICTDGGATEHKAVTTIGTNATVELRGGIRISSTNSGAATAYDLFRQSGTISVGAGVEYDDAKISGTITFLNVYGVTPTAAGLNTLST